MNAIKTQFPKPRWALTLWATQTDILVEMPMSDGGEPYYIKYPLSEGGLTKALALLKFQRDECHRSGPREIKIDGRVLTTKAKNAINKPITAGTTQANRDRVREILKKRGLI